MGELLRRGEALARQAQHDKVSETAERLVAVFGTGAVQIDEARVLVSGRGIVKRWLIDPSLRFLGGGLK